MKTFVKIMLVALLMSVGVGAAHADQFNLTLDHCSGGCNPGAPGTSMGTVTLAQNGTNDVLITVALVADLKFVNTGLVNTIDFNIAGEPAISLGLTSLSQFALASGTHGNDHFDGFGTFEYSLELSTAQGAGGAVCSTIPPCTETFDIHSSSALNVADFETDGAASNVFFGVDVYNFVNGNTGPIGSGAGTPPPPSSTPEPGTLVLFGSGMFGLAGLIRKRFSN